MSCNQEMWSTLEVSCVYPILVPQDEMLHFTCIVQRESPKHVYYAILKNIVHVSFHCFVKVYDCSIRVYPSIYKSLLDVLNLFQHNYCMHL